MAVALALAERGLAIARTSADIFDLAMQVGVLQRDLGQGEPALRQFQQGRMTRPSAIGSARPR